MSCGDPSAKNGGPHKAPISFAKALELIRAKWPRPIAGLREAGNRTELVPVEKALGRVLSESITATMASPAFDNSAMDGFAFHHADLSGFPDGASKIKVQSTSYAGSSAGESFESLATGCCIRIMTGAPLPRGADTVIPVESTKLRSDGTVDFNEIPAKGSHIRLGGEDIAIDQLLFEANTPLRAEHLMVLANFGISQVQVRPQPRVFIISTGDEIRPLGEVLEPGQIYNSSRYFLGAALEALGIKPFLCVTATDDPQKLSKLITEQLNQAEADSSPSLIITTGAVSAGERDFVPALAADLQFTKLFHHVAIRPGKPIFVATREDHIWLGLPGNPISTAATWHFLGRAILAAWAGIPKPLEMPVRLAQDCKKPGGLRCFYRARVENSVSEAVIGEKDMAIAEIFPKQGSAHFLASLRANAYIHLPESMSTVTKDTVVVASFI